MYETIKMKIAEQLSQAGVLPLKAQAELSTRILREKLETVLPWAMEEGNFDMWIVVSRENGEDPILKTLFTWDMPTARRTSILIFARNAASGDIRRMCVGRHSPEMNAIYENVQREGETVWETLKRIVTETDPQRIALNRSRVFGACDGLSATLYEDLAAAVGETYKKRLVDGEELTARWMQRVTRSEKLAMKALVDATHAIIDFAFSDAFIKPGVTGTEDVEWCMRQIINEVGFSYWFGPDVDLQRQGSDVSRMSGETILPGDLIHCDIGVKPTYLHLHTDTQWVAYVTKQGESAPPDDMQTLLDTGNRFRAIVMDAMTEGKPGNDVFFEAMETAKNEGINAMLYTHPVGTAGHGVGPTIGLYTNQGFVAGSGERPVENDTCYALELNVYDDLPCWNGQKVFMYLEENICRSDSVDYISDHQTKLMVIGHTQNRSRATRFERKII